MPMQASVAVGDQGASLMQPRFSGLSHVSLACRDLAESKRFYSEVLGGELVHEIPGFVEYRIADVIFGLSEQNQGWTAPDHEYPHYAFYLDGPNFDRMIHWLDQHGVPNHPYRRDPTAWCIFEIRPVICSSCIVILVMTRSRLCRRRRDGAGRRSIFGALTIAGTKIGSRGIQPERKNQSSAASHTQAFIAAISRRPSDFSQTSWAARRSMMLTASPKSELPA